jgi:hypothetical protein
VDELGAGSETVNRCQESTPAAKLGSAAASIGSAAATGGTLGAAGEAAGQVAKHTGMDRHLKRALTPGGPS